MSADLGGAATRLRENRGLEDIAPRDPGASLTLVTMTGEGSFAVGPPDAHQPCRAGAPRGSRLGYAAAMAQGLSHYARLYLAGKPGFAEAVGGPVLLWVAAPGPSTNQESWQPTESGQVAPRPRAGEPLVLRVQKAPEKKNPFAMGITLGRVLHNDIVVDDVSVSRFHAYFQQDPRSGAWTVADAESTNGSQLNGSRLAPNARVPVSNRAMLRFGDVDLTFLEPEGLWDVIARSP